MTPSTSPMKSWFSIRNADKPTVPAEVLIYDEIGHYGITASDFMRELRALGNNRELTVRINSPGGSVIEGVAIYNYLSALPNVTTVVDGMAASIASVIFLAGRRRIMAENSFVMIHEVEMISAGRPDDLRRDADLSDKFQNSLIAIYVAKTGQDADAIRALMSAETWFDATEAMANGFATEIGAPLALTNSFSLQAFRNAPASLAHHGRPTNSISATGAANKSSEANMKLFGPSSRETFLLSALAAVGLTEDQIDAAQKAAAADFLSNALTERLSAEVATAKGGVTADLESARACIAKIDAGLRSLALLPTGAEGYSLEALTAAVEAREAAARKAGEDAATLRVAQELAARGHAPVATAPAAAATNGEPPKPGEGLTGLAKVTAIFRAEQAAARQN